MNRIQIKRYRQYQRPFGGFRTVFCLVLAVVMIFSGLPGAASYALGDEEAAGTVIEIEEGTFVPGEVIVVFRDGAVKDRDTSLRRARKLDNIDDGYGSAMDAVGGSDEAADDAGSEVKILRAKLGDEFVIRDSVAFDDDLAIALVSSEKYDTETLINMLSDDPDIASAEPNWYTENTSYNYSLNDTLNQYAYQTNSPADENAAGKNVSGRGTDPDKTLSARVGAVTDFTADHPGEDEVVVAVIDSGINYKHEDLKNMLWNNPGNIGLRGEHGFNFDDNSDEIMDSTGHGTHISGIIAAEANNAKGIAGIASGVNVKIMMLSDTSAREKKAEGDDKSEKEVSTLYSRVGAMNYVLRARENGVNVAAVNCSWGVNGYSFAYDKILDRLGEAGILSFLASGNNAECTDEIRDDPSGTSSQYAVVLGSADVSGKPSAFSNYGKSNVDIFSTGSNVLSTVPYSTYFPGLYTEEERAANTEYYGQFSTETVIGDYDPALGMKRVIPDTAGAGVKPFGAAKFVKDAGDGNGDAEGPETVCEVSVETDKTFTDNYVKGAAAKPASLKVTIKNARRRDKYYLYFPYDKNHETTGSDNTSYSGSMIVSYDPEDFLAEISCGEVVRREEEGKLSAQIMNAYSTHSDAMNDGTIMHASSSTLKPGPETQDESILSWDEADPDKTDVRETGLGFKIEISALGEGSTDEEDEAYDSSIRDITFYIDSIGVSRPVTGDKKLEDVFPADSSYDLMSGTSQATPAAAGAYAVIASLNPQRKGQSGADYAKEMRAELFSCVRQTDELKDLCSTGGYVDLSLLKEDPDRPSVTDAVCDADRGTITLYGSGLSEDLEVNCRSLAKKGAAERRAAEEGIRTAFAGDGRSVTLSNAKSLMGTYTEFILRNSEGAARARGSFFLVNGYKGLDKVLTEEHKATFYGEEENLPARYIFTDTDGKTVYGYQMNSASEFAGTAGVLYRFDGSGFAEIHGTKLRDAVFDYYENELGYDRHQLTRGLDVKPWTVKQALYCKNILYDFVDVTFTPYDNAPDEEKITKHYLASLNYTSAKPAWSFTETDPRGDILADISGYDDDKLAYCAYDGKIYMFGSPAPDAGITEKDHYTFVYSCDVETGKWEKGNFLEGTSLSDMYAYPAGGKIYLMFGREAYHSENMNRIYSYDGQNWKKLTDIPFVGRTAAYMTNTAAAVAPVKDGLMFINYSIEGAGNISLYNASKDRFEPLYYTLNGGLSEPQLYEGSQSAVETKGGIYFIRLAEDPGSMKSLEMFRLPKESGTYRTSYPDEDTSGIKPQNKYANTAKIKSYNKVVKYKKLKKKGKVTIKAVTVSNAKGKLTYSLDKITCKNKLRRSAKKKIRLNKTNGKITLKKGLKKGKYKLRIKVSAAGDDTYNAAQKTVTLTIRVR